MIDDKYTYPGSGGLLINTFNIKDPARLDQAMNDVASAGIGVLGGEELPDRFDFDYLAHVHQVLLGPVVLWAGQIQDVNMQASGTGIAYCRPEYIRDQLQELFSQLDRDGQLQRLPDREFAHQLAEHWGHPVSDPPIPRWQHTIPNDLRGKGGGLDRAPIRLAVDPGRPAAGGAADGNRRAHWSFGRTPAAISRQHCRRLLGRGPEEPQPETGFGLRPTTTLNVAHLPRGRALSEVADFLQPFEHPHLVERRVELQDAFQSVGLEWKSQHLLQWVAEFVLVKAARRSAVADGPQAREKHVRSDGIGESSNERLFLL
ncbi:hypothetical protein [Rudaeicoccus suwonensis]|uniref:hypothetical protein n=1 Tax=Rudaeicoccus suwonensis TaxID=657409 RepID=UPI00119DC123|nr:hypothetical protein [Rudaeicoccus suwonensis]